MRKTATGKIVPLEKEAPFAFIAVIVPSVLISMVAPGNEAVASLEATLIVPVPAPGAPVMYWFAPLLPADATTITPALATFVEATADASSAVPKTEPSDMLITSTSSSNAMLMASTVTLVEPAQPKTR